MKQISYDINCNPARQDDIFVDETHNFAHSKKSIAITGRQKQVVMTTCGLENKISQIRMLVAFLPLSLAEGKAIATYWANQR